MKQSSPWLPTYTFLFCVLLMAGCSHSSPGDSATLESVESRGDAAAAAWNAEIDKAREESSVDQVKEILEDHKITSAELAHLQDELRECLRPAGVTDVSFSTSEVQYETNTPPGNPAEFVKKMDACEDSVGYSQVAALYFGMLRNPENRDYTPELVDCLVEKGLVPSSYSVDDYRRDLASDRLPFATSDESMVTYAQCAALLEGTQ